MGNPLLDSYVKGGSTSAPISTPNTLLSSYVARSPVAVTAPQDPTETHLVNSFKAIDPVRRQAVLNTFIDKANAGDKTAARKVALLSPHFDAPAPATPNFTPKDFGSQLGSTLYDLGKGAVDSAETTAKTITTLPHALTAAGISLASMADHQTGDKLAKSKQKVLDEINQTPFGSGAKTVAQQQQIPITKTLANVGGKTLENVLNVATLGEGTAAKQAAERGAKRIASKASVNLATKQAATGQAGFIRNLASGQFARTAVHPDDASVMAAFIDHARGITKLSAPQAGQLEQDASRIAEHYGIGGAQTATKGNPVTRLANAFDTVLSSSPEALRNIKESGHIAVPDIALPEGKLLTGSAGERLATGAKLGAGYGVAQAGQQNITNPTDIAKTVGTSALTGGALGVAGPAGANLIGKVAKAGDRYLANPVNTVAEHRVVASGQTFGSASDYSKAVDAEVANIKSNPAQVQAINEAYTKGGGSSLSADTGKQPVQVSVTGQPAAPGPPSVMTAEQGAKNRAIAASTDQNLSSRAHQFDPGALSETIKTLESDSRYQASLKASGGDKVISNKAVLQAAGEAGPLDHNAIINAKPLDKIDTVTLVRAKATVDQAAKEFLDNWQNMAQKGLSEKDITAQAGHIGKLEAGYKVMSAEPGRATQIQSTFIDDAFKRAQKLKDLMNTTKGITPEIRNQRIAQDLAEFDKKLEQAKQSGQISGGLIGHIKAAFIHDLIPAAKALSEYGTSAKLTSPLTHVKNLAGNVSTLMTRGAEKAFTISWGAAKGETSLGEAKYIFGSSQGFKNAFSQLGKDLKQAVNPLAKDIEESTSKAETNKSPAISSTSLNLDGKLGKTVDVTGKVVRTPFNLLSAGDNFFKTLLHDSEIHSQAFSKAYQEGFRGSALDARVNEIAAHPTPEMLARAKTKGEEFTLQDDPGVVANHITEILAKLPLFRLLIPFVKTPTNAVKFQYQRSVAGVFSKRNITDIMQGGIERREAVARLTVGTGMSLGSAIAVFNLGDNITGAAPKNTGAKDNFYTASAKPYSIRIGGKWYQYNALQPLGQYLTQAVALRDALTSHDSKTAGNLLSSMSATIAKGFTDLPFVSGVSNVIAALNDPTNTSVANKALGGIVTGLIPNASRDIANAQDPTARDSKTITDQVKAMIPGLKQTLPARQTVFGTNQVSTNSAVDRGLIKVTSNDQSNRLTKAIDAIGKETGYYPTPPNVTGKVNGKVLTPEQAKQYKTQSGQVFATKLEAALNDTAFHDLSAEDQKRTLQKMVTDARTQAADAIVGKQTRNPSHKVKAY